MHLFSRSRRLTTLTPHAPFSHAPLAPHPPSLYALGALPLTPHAPVFACASCASCTIFIRPRRLTPTPHAPLFCMRLMRLMHLFYTPSAHYPQASCTSCTSCAFFIRPPSCTFFIRLRGLTTRASCASCTSFICPLRLTTRASCTSFHIRLMHLFYTPSGHYHPRLMRLFSHPPHAPLLYALGALPPAPHTPLFTSASRAFFIRLRGLTTRASCASFHICLTRLFYTPSEPLHTPMRLFSHPPHAPFYTPSASYHPRLMRLFSCILFIYALGVLPGTQACTFDIKPSTVPVRRFLPAHKPFLVVHFDGSFYSRPLVVHAARAYRSRRTRLHVYFILLPMLRPRSLSHFTPRTWRAHALGAFLYALAPALHALGAFPIRPRRLSSTSHTCLFSGSFTPRPQTLRR
ncbi:hypothetical protein C8J57DRAFT_1531475 [Mycena rebaudengoi]|nr:hypothetical protein C8J57DRAFT_1531475 [Mycena rebaudengoi]